MAAPTITSHPGEAYTGEEITIEGTNFEDSEGGDPITSVQFTGNIDAAYYRVISTTEIKVGVPTLADNENYAVTITNGSGNASTSDIGIILTNVGRVVTDPATLVVEWTTDLLKNTGKLITPPATLIIEWTTNLLNNTGKVITPPATLIIEWMTSLLSNSGKVVTPPATLIVEWTTAGETPDYTIDLGFEISGEDCKTLKVTDITNYSEEGLTRTDYNFDIQVQDFFTKEVITMAADSTNKQNVEEWTGTLKGDSIYEVLLFEENAIGTVYSKSFVLKNCAGNKCVNDENQAFKDNIQKGNQDNLEQLMDITALNNILIANFKQKNFEKAKDIILEFQSYCKC